MKGVCLLRFCVSSYVVFFVTRSFCLWVQVVARLDQNAKDLHSFTKRLQDCTELPLSFLQRHPEAPPTVRVPELPGRAQQTLDSLVTCAHIAC